MKDVSLQAVNHGNWLAALRLSVHPNQQHFVTRWHLLPVALVVVAKAFVRRGGFTWEPYAVYADADLVGFLTLAYRPGSLDQYWLFHFFIDRGCQGRGYGKAALEQFLVLVKSKHPQCRILQLTVHPANRWAQQLYTHAGFSVTGTMRWEEPVYQLALRDL